MTSGTIAIDTAAERRPRAERRLPATPGFEGCMVALSTAVAAGAHVDAWAHGHIARVDGVWWPVHLWAGAPVVAGLTGWIVSLVVLPPPASETATLPS